MPTQESCSATTTVVPCPGNKTTRGPQHVPATNGLELHHRSQRVLRPLPLLLRKVLRRLDAGGELLFGGLVRAVAVEQIAEKLQQLGCRGDISANDLAGSNADLGVADALDQRDEADEEVGFLLHRRQLCRSQVFVLVQSLQRLPGSCQTDLENGERHRNHSDKARKVPQHASDRK